MAKVVGLGGAFIFAQDPERLAQWYADNLGFRPQHNPGDGSWFQEFKHRALDDASRVETSTWVVFPGKAEGAVGEGRCMFNYRVDNLDAVLAKLAETGVVLNMREDFDYGRFAWVTDPEGNPVELFEESRRR